MLYFGAVRFFIFNVIIIGLLCSANDIKHLKARVKLLETRLNSEVYFRDEEYAEITERLDDIDKVFNVTEATATTKQSVVPKTKKVNELDYKSVNSLRGDIERIRTAFREEKNEAERIRREIPNIQNNLKSVNEDVDNYCKSALNNSGKLLTDFKASSASETQLLLDVKENIQEIKNIRGDDILAQQEDRLILKDMTAKLLLNTKNYEKMYEQIQNLKNIVADILSEIKSSLLYGSSCLHLKQMGRFSGLYKLYQGIDVYCDQVTDGGGWTVFQRRLDGEVDFYRNWTEYKKGFGDLDGEFWLGNDHLSSLTAEEDHELRVEIEDFEGNIAYAKFSKFKVYPEEDKYKLEVSGYSGTAGDSLNRHNGMMFTTFDRNNDKASSGNCADLWHGAWWYDNCYDSNLNGRYYDEPGKTDVSGITWFYWKKNYHCLKKVEMKFR